MKASLLIGAIAAASANQAVHAVCPITECNYSDPQYQASTKIFYDCINPVIDQFTRAMEGLAIGYPRFGIAWRAQDAEIKAATSVQTGVDTAAFNEATRRFEDRILRTAEPEALQFYNLWQLKIKQQTERCGPMPEPPRK